MNSDLQSQTEKLKSELLELFHFLGLEDKKRQLKILEEKIKQADFWQKEQEPARVQEEFFKLKGLLEKLEALEKEVSYLQELSFLNTQDVPERKEIESKIAEVRLAVAEELKKAVMTGKYDKGSATIYIQAGAGGRDSEDWVCLLLRMYEHYFEAKHWNFKILYQQLGEGGGPEGRIGIKEVVLEINGAFSYGFLKKETGVHRLVRISPFSAKKLRHTSFAKVEVLPKIQEGDMGEIKVRPEDLKIETFRASGPGGQNVNRRETAVRITHLPTGLQAASQAERLQNQNKKIAFEFLLAKIASQKERENEEELKKIKGGKIVPSFGNQIRSYILHPYKLVKDHRTNVETSDVEGMLNGNLDQFIDEELKM